MQDRVSQDIEDTGTARLPRDLRDGLDAAGMSKARLVVTAVTAEKRPVAEVARSYGVARSWVYTLLARYQAEGEAIKGG